MEEYEYMWIQLSFIPQEIIDQYDLDSIKEDVCVYIDIQKGMLVLKQAGKISNDQLCTHLEKYGYEPVRHIPTSYKHEARYAIFTLVVGDFGIKITRRKDSEHVSIALVDSYVITKYWEGIF